MKKYWVIIISLLLLAPCVWAQTIKRTSKMPGFFVPKGALQTGYKPERLVPIEALQYQGRQTPTTENIQQQEQEKTQKDAKEKVPSAAEEKRRQEQAALEEEKQKELNKLSKEQEATTEKETVSLQAEEIPTANETTAIYPENKKLSAQQAARLKAEKIKQNLTKQQEQKTDDALFTQIITEYRRDIKAISEGKPIKNQRLTDMIADYKDVERPI